MRTPQPLQQIREKKQRRLSEDAKTVSLCRPLVNTSVGGRTISANDVVAVERDGTGDQTFFLLESSELRLQNDGLLYYITSNWSYREAEPCLERCYWELSTIDDFAVDQDEMDDQCVVVIQHTLEDPLKEEAPYLKLEYAQRDIEPIVFSCAHDAEEWIQEYLHDYGRIRGEHSDPRCAVWPV